MKFEDKWTTMRNVVSKLLKQETVTHEEWQDLFFSVHIVCLWDDKGPTKLRENLHLDIVQFIQEAQVRVLSHQEDQALLKAYISEWRKFFTQCNYLPTPFKQLEASLQGKSSTGSYAVQSGSKKVIDESLVRKLMLDSWNESIFSDIKDRLQDSAMKLVQAERNGEPFDSQLVIGKILHEFFLYILNNPVITL